MQKTFFLLYSIVFCFVTSGNAQIGGRSTYQFLNLVSAPRQAALGGKQITAYDEDPSATLYNPASVNESMHQNLSLNYVNYFADINYGSVAYATSIGKLPGTFYTGVTYIDYGAFDGFDELGNATGNFSGNEVALSIGYGTKISDSNFYLGAGVKFISSKLEQYTSLGGALDLGLMYYHKESGWITGVAVRNAGIQFRTYAGVTEDLPLEVAFGMSKLLKNVPIRWSFTLENVQQWNLAFRNSVRDQEGLNGETVKEDDPGFFNNFLRHTVYGLTFFPERKFSFRLGYNFRRGEELRILDERAFAGLSGGLVLRVKRLAFSYTYARYSAAASSSFFGLNIDLN